MAPEGGLRFRFAKRSERAQSANSFSPEGSKFIVLNTGVKPLISPKFGSKGTRETKTSSRPSPTQKFKVRITGLNKIEVPIRCCATLRFEIRDGTCEHHEMPAK